MDPKEPKKKNEEGVRPFDATLRALSDGAVHSDLSSELHKLVGELEEMAINSGGKPVKGALTLVLGVTVSANGSAVIHADVKVKTPKPTRLPSVLFITKGGNLSVDNQRQTKLPLHEVPNNKPLEAAAEERPVHSV